MSHYSQPRLSHFDAAGARIAYFEWGDVSAEPLLLIHATGFHARVWDQVIAHLRPGYRVIAVETRGHGRSEKRGPVTDWVHPAEDLLELLHDLKLKPAVGAGHSKGGHLLVQIAARMPSQFSRLILIDPVIMSPEMYAQRLPWPDGIEHPVSRRRNRWDTWEEMRELFTHRKPYSLWQPQVLEDYCRYGVMPTADGKGVELACPPSIEASIYMGAGGPNIISQTHKISIPVTVLRAQQRKPGPRDFTDFSASPTWDKLAEQFPNGRDVYLPELTHFMPMQDPALIAAYIDAA